MWHTTIDCFGILTNCLSLMAYWQKACCLSCRLFCPCVFQEIQMPVNPKELHLQPNGSWLLWAAALMIHPAQINSQCLSLESGWAFLSASQAPESQIFIHTPSSAITPQFANPRQNSSGPHTPAVVLSLGNWSTSGIRSCPKLIHFLHTPPLSPPHPLYQPGLYTKK